MNKNVGFGRRLFTFILLGLLPLSASAVSSAQCGSPPVVTDGGVKAEVAGKANALSKLAANAEFSAKVDSTRQDIFQKYPDAAAARADAYLHYQVCVLIMDDKTMSTQQKLDALKAFDKPPPPKVEPTPISMSANLKPGGHCDYKETIDVAINNNSDKNLLVDKAELVPEWAYTRLMGSSASITDKFTVSLNPWKNLPFSYPKPPPMPRVKLAQPYKINSELTLQEADLPQPIVIQKFTDERFYIKNHNIEHFVIIAGMTGGGSQLWAFAIISR
jgi:hypothetical protein